MEIRTKNTHILSKLSERPLLLISMGLLIAGVIILLTKPSSDTNHEGAGQPAEDRVIEKVKVQPPVRDGMYKITCYSTLTNDVMQTHYSPEEWKLSEYDDAFTIFDAVTGQRVTYVIAGIYCSSTPPKNLIVAGVDR